VLTVSGVSVPGLPTETRCGIDAEAGTEIGDVLCLSVLITAIGVWSTATPAATSSGKLLEGMDLNQCKSDDRIQSLTWFLHLSLRYSYHRLDPR
jgi:hypothetical protein